MAYISLYRKYRPQTFEDVVGQEHVTTTLRNALQEGRIASGYLFTGTRGTAKTTCARILAKALNCIGPDGTGTAPTPEPCCVCGPCRAVAASSFVDVLEMDAASHGKVDDVRDLVASIKFPPMEGRYKVYIIDEAHQLSRDAMDAFLKTLEEPPDRVVFVLATTELDKLPITIASRCQVYEFKRGSVAQISARLTQVLKSENVKADPAAVTLIARAADGSYRDSLSLLEQVLAYQREHVTAQDVTLVLGTIDEDVLAQVVDLIADSDAAGAFAQAGTILESGKDVRQFLKSLAERFRDMLFVGVGARVAAEDAMDDGPRLRVQAARFAPSALLSALETLTAAEQDTKRSTHHRLLLEMALLKLMRLPSSAAAPQPVASVAPQHEAVETPIVERPVFTEPVAPVIRSNGHAPLTTPVITPVIAPVAEPVLPPAVPYDMPPPLADAEVPDDDTDLDDDAGLDTLLPGDDDLDSLPLGEDEEAMPSAIVVSPEQHEEQHEEADLLQVQQVAVEAAPPAPPKPDLDADTPPELIRLQKSWREVVNRLSSKPATAAIIRDAQPIALTGQTVTLQFTSDFNVDKVEKNARGREVVEEAINKTLGTEPGFFKVRGILKGQPLPTRVGPGRAPQTAPSLPAPAAAGDKPGAFVDEVIAVFGGRLLDDDPKG